MFNKPRITEELTPKTPAGGDGQFTTEVSNVSYYGAGDGIEFTRLSATVKWSLNAEMKSWGVKGIAPTVNSVELDGDKEAFDKAEGGSAERLTMSVPGIGYENWNIQVDFSSRTVPMDIAPRMVEVHWDEHKIYVEF